MKIDLSDTKKIIQRYRKKKGILIPLLQDIQAIYGYVPQESIELISKELSIYPVEIYGIVTFYAQFYLTSRGKYIIRVCQGTACHVRGTPDVLNEIGKQLNIRVGETTPDNNFTLETVRCLGTCAIGPVITIDGKYYGQMNSKKVHSILKKYDKKIERTLV